MKPVSPSAQETVTSAPSASRSVASSQPTTAGTPSVTYTSNLIRKVNIHVGVRSEIMSKPTQDYVRTILELASRTGFTRHFEIETYTWDALPAEVRAETLVESLAREIEWTKGVLVAAGCREAEIDA